MGEEAERWVKAFCLCLCLIFMLVLTGAGLPDEDTENRNNAKMSYRFISLSQMDTLEEDSAWRTDVDYRGSLEKSLRKNGDADARWVYIFRQ